MRKWWLGGSFCLGAAGSLILTPGPRGSHNVVHVLLLAIIALAFWYADLRKLGAPGPHYFHALARGKNLVIATAGLVTFSFCFLNLGFFYGLRWERLGLLKSNAPTVQATVVSRSLRPGRSPRPQLTVNYTAAPTPGADPADPSVAATERKFPVPAWAYFAHQAGDTLRVFDADAQHPRARPADFDLDEAVVPASLAWWWVCSMLTVLTWGVLRAPLASRYHARRPHQEPPAARF